MPAQDVTLLDCTAPSDWVTHSELPKVATILFRLCRTARHPFSWNKRVLVGCGGGFHQECQQPYSPVASWMEDTDVALNDEGQQYGNLDEASAIARAPRKCLVIWCGDHKQTPGGLRSSCAGQLRSEETRSISNPICWAKWFSGFWTGWMNL